MGSRVLSLGWIRCHNIYKGDYVGHPMHPYKGKSMQKFHMFDLVKAPESLQDGFGDGIIVGMILSDKCSATYNVYMRSAGKVLVFKGDSLRLSKEDSEDLLREWQKTEGVVDGSPFGPYASDPAGPGLKKTKFPLSGTEFTVYVCSECSTIYAKEILVCPACKANFKKIDKTVLLGVENRLHEAADMVIEARLRFDHTRISKPDLYGDYFSRTFMLISWINDAMNNLRTASVHC